MLEAMKEFYADAMPHSNQELYDYFKELIGEENPDEQRHLLRGLQQTLKRDNELVNIGHGIWQAA